MPRFYTLVFGFSKHKYYLRINNMFERGKGGSERGWGTKKVYNLAYLSNSALAFSFNIVRPQATTQYILRIS